MFSDGSGGGDVGVEMGLDWMIVVEMVIIFVCVDITQYVTQLFQA